VVGTTPQPQATVESATTGTFVDNGDGTYQYTFAKDISKDTAVTYDPTLTHRIAFEIRGLAPANSPVYTVQPSSGATTGITARDIVEDQTCTSCHSQLAFHGGARTEIGYCVMCHNPSSIDPSSGNALDFKVMFHKIHMGEDLPSVAAGTHYYVFGFRNSINDYSDVAFPVSDASGNNAAVSGTGQRFCTTCHDANDTRAPQAGNFQSVVNSQSCGSCHDDVNFATGQNHSAANLVASDTDCVTCHGPTSTIDNGALRVVAAHQTPVDAAAAKFMFNILSATNTAPGQTPAVTIKVTDPTNNNAPYDILQAGGPFKSGSAALRVDVAWDVTDFKNIGSNSAPTPTTGTPNQPIVLNFLGTPAPVANPDGSFTLTATAPIPNTAAGSGTIAMEGRANASLPNKTGGTTNTSLGVAGATMNFAITDSTPHGRRQVVDIAKCNTCHRVLTLHGENRTDNIELCASCHNPNATDIPVHASTTAGSLCNASTPGTTDAAIDLKYMIHQIHASATYPASGAYPAGVTICGFGSNPVTFSVGYPGALNNCLACHKTDTYYPVDPAVVQGTTIHAGPTLASADRQSVTDDIVISPNAAVCSSCHIDAQAKAHMTQNGGDFNATKAATGALISATAESCRVCHGPGAIADVKVVHNVSSFH
jgi:OmcA/MtrC family decaheme c-type cytochrome